MSKGIQKYPPPNKVIFTIPGTEKKKKKDEAHKKEENRIHNEETSIETDPELS